MIIYFSFNWIVLLFYYCDVLTWPSALMTLSSLSIVGQPMTLNGAFLSPLPGKGKLEFDFIGGGRPRADVVVRRSITQAFTIIRVSSYRFTIAGYE